MEYADYEYYVESYLLGRQPDIPESTFRYYEKQAEKEIDRVTFDRAKRMETPKEVKDCVCDVAELIFKAEKYGGSDAPGPLARHGESKVVTGRHLKYSTARHPLATAEWEKKMKATRIDDYTGAIQAYVKGHKL